MTFSTRPPDYTSLFDVSLGLSSRPSPLDLPIRPTSSVSPSRPHRVNLTNSYSPPQSPLFDLPSRSPLLGLIRTNIPPQTHLSGFTPRPYLHLIRLALSHWPCHQLTYLALFHRLYLRLTYMALSHRPCLHLIYVALPHRLCLHLTYVALPHRPCLHLIYVVLPHRLCLHLTYVALLLDPTSSTLSSPYPIGPTSLTLPHRSCLHFTYYCWQHGISGI